MSCRFFKENFVEMTDFFQFCYFVPEVHEICSMFLHHGFSNCYLWKLTQFHHELSIVPSTICWATQRQYGLSRIGKSWDLFSEGEVCGVWSLHRMGSHYMCLCVWKRGRKLLHVPSLLELGKNEAFHSMSSGTASLLI